MHRILLFVFGVSWLPIAAQQSVANEGPQAIYDQAMISFQQESFDNAARLFDRYLESSNSNDLVEAKYYAAISRLKSDNASGLSEVQEFIAEQPIHPLAGGANFIVGDHFFNQQDYEKAIEYYELVSKSQLSVDEQEAWLFRSAYANMSIEQIEKAKALFSQVIDYRGDYYIDASYYLGSLYFNERNYSNALVALEPIDNNTNEYGDEVSLLIASCYFETRTYNRLYTYAETKLKTASGSGKKELNRLMGEAYYSQKNYDKAAVYLQRYIDLNRRTSASTHYKLALSYFEISQNKQAIEHFKLAGLEKGELGQLSSFYLGQLYMKENNLNYAYSAFKKVTETDAQKDMVEEAYITLAKINYQRNQFAEAVTDFNVFLDKYPNSRWRIEANELLAQSYLKSSNYDQALAHLESINNKSTPLKRAYQKVAFQKGQLLFNDSKFSKAADYFEKASIYAMDREISAQAYYLKGECLSVLNQYDQARDAYRKSISQGVDEWANKSRYGLGYISYNEKDYKSAERFFQDFIQNSFKRDELTVDARLRLADCYYVQKDYDRAVRQYKEVSQPEYASYITYQLGLVYQLKGDDQMAISYFDQTIRDNQSAYADNAYFQKGKVYVSKGNFKGAANTYQELLRSFSESNLVPYAKTDLALCYFNLNELENAKEVYMDVLDNHINHEMANDALLGLQEVIKKGVKVKDFEAYMDRFQASNPDDGSLEVVAFEDAKASYYNQKYEEAVRKLNTFNSKYSNSGFSLDADYFLADSYYRMSKWSEAIASFDVVINEGSSSYLVRSLDKRGNALMEQKNYKEAVKNYLLLSRKAGNRKELYLSQEGLMNAYYESNSLDSALYYANEILSGDWKPGNVESDTWLIKGRIFLRQQNFGPALDEFIKVANEGVNENGAEAKYLIGTIYHRQKQYKRSLEILFDLNRNYGSYPRWVGKSFLLIADNYLGMGELLQAEATVQSIIDNATIPEIVSEAKKKMTLIQQKADEVIVSDNQQDSIK
jgi:tetratricopeptide (TPR) repeat protein